MDGAPPVIIHTEQAKKKMKSESIEQNIPRCIAPITRVQAICRNMCSLTFIAASLILVIYSFFISKRLSDRCISFLMVSLTIVWILIGLENAIRHILWFAKISMSLMCIAIGMLLILPAHVASQEVYSCGIYEKGVFFGVKTALVLFFFAAGFWFLAWTCFVTDHVLRDGYKKRGAQEMEMCG